MFEYAYTSGTGKLKKFLDEIHTSGVPGKLTHKELEKRGYRTKEDRRIVSILKAIGFADNSGVPTKRYTDYRNNDISKKVLAEGIREGYPNLFRTYPNAYKQDPKKLQAFFSSDTTLGAQAVNYIVGTFQALCSLANFDGEDTPINTDGKELTEPSGNNSTSPKVPISPEMIEGSSVTINVNLQLSLPETKDYEIYDKIFESLKKNLLDRK